MTSHSSYHVSKLSYNPFHSANTLITSTCLYMFDELYEQGFFMAVEIENEMDISRPTFFRALADCRQFLKKFNPEKTIVLDYQSKKYTLVTRKTTKA